MSPQIKKHMKDVDKIRAEAFPSHTCPASRHAHIMAETLAKGKEYAMFLEEPEHCADTLLAVIGSLWQARMKAAELERQLAEAQKDAERYRWLRAQDYVVASKHPAELLVFGTDGVLDAAIDTALKEQSKC